MRWPFLIAIAMAVSGIALTAAESAPPASQPATEPTSQPDAEPDTQPAAPAANNDQDGPGMYHITAGPGGKYSITLRAKSREDAIALGIATVGQKAMDNDENVYMGSLKVEKVGP